jgi:hypothetical protein
LDNSQTGAGGSRVAADRDSSGSRTGPSTAPARITGERSTDRGSTRRFAYREHPSPVDLDAVAFGSTASSAGTIIQPLREHIEADARYTDEPFNSVIELLCQAEERLELAHAIASGEEQPLSRDEFAVLHTGCCALQGGRGRPGVDDSREAGEVRRAPNYLTRTPA